MIKIKNNFSQQEIQSIIRKYTCEYESLKKIGKDFSVGYRTIRQILVDNNIEISVRRPPMYLQWSEEKRQEVISNYQNGESLASLAQKEQCNIAVIEKLFRDNNIVIRSIHRNIKIDLNFWKNIDNAEKAYWLGMMYSDGWITQKYVREALSGFGLSLKIDDIEHIKKFQKALKTDQQISYIKKENKKYMARLQISSKEMAEDLEKLGCTIRKTYSLQYPTSSIVPVELQHHFIRGIFDGDGSIYVRPDRHSLNIAGTVKILEGIMNFLSPNYVCTIINKETYGILEISSKKGIFDFYNKIYRNAEVFMERKHQKFIEFCNKFPEECKSYEL